MLTTVVTAALGLATAWVLYEYAPIIAVSLLGSSNTHGVAFDPARDIPLQTGKVLLVTGGAGDLGRQAVIELARHKPARIYVADLPRPDAGASVLAAIRDAVPGADVRFIALDLGTRASVDEVAANVMADEDRLDLCLLNAGVMRVHPGVTLDGYEAAFGINYVGHARLVKLLLPLLLRTAKRPGADVRVVVVSSEGHSMAPRGGIQFDKVKTACENMSYFQRYGQSKVAGICFTRELARAYPQLTVVAVHPGRIVTGMALGLRRDSLLMRLTAPLSPLVCTSVDVGVRNHLWAATADVTSGKYYEPVGVPNKESNVARDEVLSKKLWQWTEDELNKGN